MEVILLEHMGKLGAIGDVVDVRNGYGRNFLIPQGKAISATEENKKFIEERRAEFEKKAADTLVASQQRAEQLNQLPPITIAMQASEEGKLYGSVGTHSIKHALENIGVNVERKEIILPKGVFRETGEYDVNIQVHSDVSALIKVLITAVK